jgi:hypothetical protein
MSFIQTNTYFTLTNYMPSLQIHELSHLQYANYVKSPEILGGLSPQVSSARLLFNIAVKARSQGLLACFLTTSSTKLHGSEESLVQVITKTSKRSPHLISMRQSRVLHDASKI